MALNVAVRGRTWNDLRVINHDDVPDVEEVADEVNTCLYWLNNCTHLMLCDHDVEALEEARQVCMRIADRRIA